jgi:8-oxo-dGTP pyrophosphatase MutT (NUDIX family)
MPATAPCPPPPPPVLPGLDGLAAALERTLRGREPRALPGPGRRAAVLIVLYEQAGAPHLLLTKRADDLPSHPGQISLPGGVIEADDPTPRDAALRETEEEVGLRRRDLRVIGELDDVHTAASGFVIRPFVAVLHARMAAVPSDREVARVIHAAVADLLAADERLPAEPAPLELRYPLEGEDVWGATARILRIFSRVTRCALARDLSRGAPPGDGPAGRGR